ncbi:MAG: hypothetical protein HXS53_05235 [Theionarchaea archaeon]|nr:hypothetical protein [Theionarchaea archaeon]
MRKKLIVTLAIIFTLLFSFIYITASGISQLSNETILFLFLDETEGEPGTVEVASLALFEDAHLSQDLMEINPLESTDELKREGLSLSDCLIKSRTSEDGITIAQTIVESETGISIDRVALIDSTSLRLIIDAVHPIPIDKTFQVTTLDKTLTLQARTTVSGTAAERCIRGTDYPGIQNDELAKIPEDYLWEVKSKIINAVVTKLLQFSEHTREERNRFSAVVVEEYKKDNILVYERNIVLTLVYYLPESVSKQIVSFAVRRIA